LELLAFFFVFLDNNNTVYMRIAIITDIHEDFAMLEKAMSLLKQKGYDTLVCLGDIIGFASEYYSHSPDANACLDFLRANADIVIAGNHDLYSCKRLPSYHLEKKIPENWYDLTLVERLAISNNSLWLYEQEVIPEISPENLQFLMGLHERYTLDTGHRKILLSHFLQPDLAGIGRWFPYRIGELRPHFKLMNECDCTLGFVGHCHPDGLTLISKLFWSSPTFITTNAGYKSRIVMCPALVSSSNKPNGCIIYDSESNEITPIYLKTNRY
jgi:predicted phosphodiesterase